MVTLTLPELLFRSKSLFSSFRNGSVSSCTIGAAPAPLPLPLCLTVPWYADALGAAIQLQNLPIQQSAASACLAVVLAPKIWELAPRRSAQNDQSCGVARALWPEQCGMTPKLFQTIFEKQLWR